MILRRIELTDYEVRIVPAKNYTKSAVVLLFSAVLAAGAGCLLVLAAGSIDAAVRFAQDNVELAFAGGSAFYLLLRAREKASVGISTVVAPSRL